MVTGLGATGFLRCIILRTAYLVGVTGERMVRVSCIGWGDESQILKDNAYNNPFWNETAFFVTDKGNAFRVTVYWNAPVGLCER